MLMTQWDRWKLSTANALLESCLVEFWATGQSRFLYRQNNPPCGTHVGSGATKRRQKTKHHPLDDSFGQRARRHGDEISSLVRGFETQKTATEQNVHKARLLAFDETLSVLVPSNLRGYSGQVT